MRAHPKNKQTKTTVTERTHSSKVLNSLDVGILFADREGFIFDMNDSFCRMLGYERHELIGKYFLTLVPGPQRECTLLSFTLAMDSPIPRPAEAEFPVQTKDGYIFGANCKMTVITKPDNGRYMIGTVTDITEVNNYKQLLEETEMSTSIGGWLLDVQINQLSCTEGMYKLLNLPTYNAITWQDVQSFTGREAYQQLKQAIQLAIDKGTPFDLELKCGHENKLKWIRAIGQAKQVFSKTIQLFGTFQDISGTKKAAGKLKKLSQIARDAVCPIVVVGLDKKVKWINAAFTQITEYTLKEIAGKALEDFLYGPETDPGTIRGLNENRNAGRIYNSEILIYTRSGRKVWFTVQAQPRFDKQGDLVGYFSICIDCTARKLSEIKILHTQRLMQQAEQIASLGSWEYDLRGNVITWSDGLYRLLGSDPKATIPSKEELLSLVHPDDLQYVTASLQRTAEGYGNFDMQHRVLLPDGSTHTIRSQGQLIKNDKGQPEKLFGVVHDITEQKAVEDKLHEQESRLAKEKLNYQRQITRATIDAQEQERLEIGKELHDNVNQILASARLFLTSPFLESEEREKLTDKAAEYIHMAIEEIRKLSHALVSPCTADLGIVETINDMIGVLRATRKIDIHFHHGHFDQSKLDNGLKLTIYRIVQEQISNILKHANARRVDIHIKQHRKKLSLTIMDNGIGFDPAAKRKGIGLNNIINRAEVFNGKVRIQSAPGQGCLLQVTFEK